MRFLMNTLLALIQHRSRFMRSDKTLSGCARALAAVFVSSANPGSRHPRSTGAAQLQLSVFWHQFNPASRRCRYGNIRIRNPPCRRLHPIAHGTFPIRLSNVRGRLRPTVE
jgi:hypothetical protein